MHLGEKPTLDSPKSTADDLEPGYDILTPLPAPDAPSSRRRSLLTRGLVCLAFAAFAFHATRPLFHSRHVNFSTGDNERASHRPHHYRPADVKDSFAFLHKLADKHAPSGREAEDLFLSVPNEAGATAASRQYTSKPHLAGSDGDLSTAEDFLRLLQHEFDIDNPTSPPIFSAGSHESRNATLSITEGLSGPNAWIDIYYPIMNTPLDRTLQILGDGGEPAWTADLEEVADETDSDAWTYRDAVPTWHGLSKGGEVEGKLIYVNYGTKEDYDSLVEKGVNFTGAIVLARYGAIFRGLKVEGAQKVGAVGCLIYSDPRDDGAITVENGYVAYPHGPARNARSVQRGSVQFLSLYPGDPTTPGYPSYENSTRTEGVNIPSIPSLPISWANAQVLLQEIEEGGENRTVKLVNHVDNKVTPIWNTMGVIPGHIKDEVVVIGNHRDAWVLGAADPSSGTASVVETVRGLGVLLKAGWKPLRTIVFASWDAEEYGLVGSTEWGEDFADWIDEHVVAYLNLDVSVSGSRFGTQASPSLAHFVRNAAEEISHPTDPLRTLWDARTDSGALPAPPKSNASILAEALKEDEEKMKAQAGSIGVGYLGSGSDYTVFLQRIGVASSNLGFSQAPNDPIYHYHSIFDTHRWEALFADPGFTRHVAVAKYLGLQTIRLADAIVLPFNTTHYAYELEGQLDNVELLATDAGITVNLTPLRASIRALQLSSLRLDDAKDKAEARLKHELRKWRRRHAAKKWLKKVWKKIKGIFKKHKGGDHDGDDELLALGERPCPRRAMAMKKNGEMMKPRVGRLPAWIKEKEQEKQEVEQSVEGSKLFEGAPDMPDIPKMPEMLKPPSHLPPHGPWFKHGHHRHHHHPPHHHSKGPGKKFIEAAKQVKMINEKLASFERGLISTEGIKDREWYRNIAIAPGKWLGYGATPLPALTEAITIDHSATSAEYEAKRLQLAVELITKSLQV